MVAGIGVGLGGCPPGCQRDRGVQHPDDVALGRHGQLFPPGCHAAVLPAQHPQRQGDRELFRAPFGLLDLREELSFPQGVGPCGHAGLDPVVEFGAEPGGFRAGLGDLPVIRGGELRAETGKLRSALEALDRFLLMSDDSERNEALALRRSLANRIN